MPVRKQFLVALGFTMPACQPAPPTDSSDAPPAPSFYVDGPSGDGICGGSGVHAHGSGVDGTCSQSSALIFLTPAPDIDTTRAVVNLAIGNWNNVIKDAKGFNVPILADAASGGIPVYFPANTSPDGEFCGTTTPGTGHQRRGELPAAVSLVRPVPHPC
jgi:hypothetical protein